MTKKAIAPDALFDARVWQDNALEDERNRKSCLEAVTLGLSRGEFFLEYLPTVSLTDGRCVGGEALIRWRRGSVVIPPLAYIPTIENTPLSGSITYWVVDTVALELGAWLREHPAAQISINVPPEVLGRGGLMYAAEKSKLIDVANQIILEITERGVPDKMGIEALNRSMGHGLKIALDDIRADDLDFVVLSRVHVDIIKLCKTFVDRIPAEEGARERLAALSALLRRSNCSVIAEGVETPRQAEALAEAGIQMAQGWLYSQSLPVRAFMAYFDEHQ